MKQYITAIILFIALCTSGIAQQPTYVGLRSSEIEGIAASQNTGMWCWAACTQMVLNFHGINITQEDVVFRTFGADAGGNLPPVGANAQIITQNLNNWNVDRNGKPYLVRAQVFRGSASADTILRHLSSRKPIILGYGPDADSGHVVVVTAVSYLRDAYGNPVITSIIVRDPYPDYWNIQNRGRREYPNGALPAPVQWMWLVDVRKQ